MRLFITLFLLLCLSCSAATPDDVRYRALSEFETADLDHVRGPAGEVSRYQIRPELWRAHRAMRDWTRPEVAVQVAKRIQNERVDAFTMRFGRLPTDYEWYLLWNAPAAVQSPSKAVSERAKRFCNLVGAMKRELSTR